MSYSIPVATMTGLVDLSDPDPATITLEAMAHGLGKLDRWAGALELPFYVAQHSQLVADIFVHIRPGLRVWRLWALKHDGHEYLLGDVITPAVKLFTQYDDAFQHRIDGIKRKIDRAIEARFSLPAAPREVVDAIAEADALAAGVEWRAWMPSTNGPCPFPAMRRSFPRPRPMNWTTAADSFRTAFQLELDARNWSAG